jgi:phosphinothricin acetyltransferase
MSETQIRAAGPGDLQRITAIYNHYVLNTPVTFDVESYTVDRRQAWFEQFGVTGRHQLLVAVEKGVK